MVSCFHVEDSFVEVRGGLNIMNSSYGISKKLLGNSWSLWVFPLEFPSLVFSHSYQSWVLPSPRDRKV